MPFPANHKGKGGGAEDAADEGCGLCGRPLDKEEPPGWIEATCSSCGTRGFHFECVSEFMQREVRSMDTRGNKKSDKSLVYARLYPQNIFARNTHIMSRKPVCPGKLGAKDCPGLMDAAELIRPTKEAPPDPADAAPAPAAAPPKKQKPLAAGAMGKASKPAGPLKAPARSLSMGGTSAVGTRLSTTGVKPGGGAAAVLGGGGAGAAPTFAQQQAQEERERKKREREERRAKAAAAAERSTVGSASGTARSATSDLPEGDPEDVWGALLGDGDAAYSPYTPADSPWDPSGTDQAAPYGTHDSAHGWPAGAGDTEDAALQAAMHASLAEGGGDIDAAALAAALRQQQELLQRQWSAAGQQAAAPPAAPEPAWEPAVPTPEASAQPMWEPSFKAAPVVDALAHAAPEPAFEATPQFERPPAPEEEVDELLALMGIS